MHVPIRRLLLLVVAVFGVVGLFAAGCGGDDDADPADEATASTVEDGGSEEADDSTGDDDALEDPAGDDPENPVVLGVQVSGPEGATLEIEAIGFMDGEAQQPLDLVATVGDEPWYFLFSGFIDAAELSMGSGTGGAVTVEALRGQAADPNNPTAGITVDEVLETVDVAEGETATIELP